MLNAIRSGSMIEIILTAFSLLVMLFVVFPVHECSHALAAKLLGDDTAERQGRITLNPFAHLDLMGTIGILAFGIGWAKPVPVNPARCRKVSQKAAMAITAAAGPMANFVSSLIFMIIMKVLIVSYSGSDSAPDALYYIIMALRIIIDIDLFNGVFNLLPVPPFDGSRVFFAFLPNKYYFAIMKYEQYIMIALLLLMWTGILSIPFSFLSNALYSLFDLITKFIC
ncbi:MAG: site-2 protease family protein [Ruminiclostridium sp.]|nr:site-2 protease family protein [Ruminiclostridium sp.]HBI51231.1 site-2 protease family protein [Oscillospiraceae bacterium]